MAALLRSALRSALCVVALWSSTTTACTTVLVGKGATADGSVIATHSNDGEGTTDPRLVKIPAASWAAGSKRPIWPNPESYPRYVGTERLAEAYYPKPGEPVSQAVGEIDQVNQTFSYFEETYGVMNEKQVAIGESTCSAVYSATSDTALLSVDEMSKIAMERASTAREAVQLMGDLAVRYGFHGQSGALEGGGESLMVIDTEEGFVFHVLADKTQTSAIWVAQRVPDDSMAVVANMYTVREVDLSDSFNFLGRQDMWDLALADGLWDPSLPKDFTATFSDGEYGHKYYSGRRMWGAWRLVAPSFVAASVPAEYGDLRYDAPYPFAVKVERKLSVRDVANVHRDWYAGTPYDLSAGLQGGFQASPDRYNGCRDGDNSTVTCSDVSGNWERSIGLFRTSDTVVLQSRGWLPDAVGGTVWFGPHAAHGTLFVPLACGMAASPDEYAYGWQGDDVSSERRRNGGFWASRVALNVMNLQFSQMLPVVQGRQALWEEAGAQLQKHLDQSLPSAADGGKLLTAAYLAFARSAVSAWWGLSDELLFTFNDGNLNRWQTAASHGASVAALKAKAAAEEAVEDALRGTKEEGKESEEGGARGAAATKGAGEGDEPVFTSSALGYPAWWLQQVGYEDGPPPVSAVKAAAAPAALTAA